MTSLETTCRILQYGSDPINGIEASTPQNVIFAFFIAVSTCIFHVNLGSYMTPKHLTELENSTNLP